jgi:bifunctional DNA-binding transcriptional regulator/antitoxin component of YhaV-PrlF toxin-antitoxin module
MPAVVTPRGQITVDREARERLGVRPGMVAVQHVVGTQLIVTFIPAPHNRSLAGILGKPPRPVSADPDASEEAVERAIAAGGDPGA